MPSENQQDRRQTLFIGEREKRFIDSIITELQENIVLQTIRIYAIDPEKTKNSNIYGEAKSKVISRIFECYARVQPGEVEIKQDRFGSDRHQVIDVYLQRERAYFDLGLDPQVGDYVEFDEKVYEIFSVVDDKPSYGSADFKIQILIKGVLSRKSTIDLATESVPVINLTVK